MRILVLHNRYNLRGGEDAVFEAECSLLREGGEDVRTLEFDNRGFKGPLGTLLGACLSLFNPFSYLRVRKAVQDFRPDVLHIHNLFSTATPSVIWAARALQIPVVMTLHNFRLLCPSATLFHEGKIFEASLGGGFPWEAVRRRVYRGSAAQTFLLGLGIWLHRRLGTWRRVDRFVALSGFAKGTFLRGGLDVLPERIAVKANFVPDRGLGREKGEEFLYVGRLSPEKGLPVLLEAFAGTKHRLAIVGEGPLEAEVEAAASKNPNLRVLGARPPEEVFALMRQAKALILPSLWYEGMPMVILESFSVGTPVVASRLGTMEELVREGGNGLHFEPGDAASLRAALDRLDGDRELHDRICQGARAAWEAGHAPAAALEALRDLYRPLAARTRMR